MQITDSINQASKKKKQRFNSIVRNDFESWSHRSNVCAFFSAVMYANVFKFDKLDLVSFLIESKQFSSDHISITILFTFTHKPATVMKTNRLLAIVYANRIVIIVFEKRF